MNDRFQSKDRTFAFFKLKPKTYCDLALNCPTERCAESPSEIDPRFDRLHMGIRSADHSAPSQQRKQTSAAA
jgi:hypothetical protein